METDWTLAFEKFCYSLRDKKGLIRWLSRTLGTEIFLNLCKLNQSYKKCLKDDREQEKYLYKFTRLCFLLSQPVGTTSQENWELS